MQARAGCHCNNASPPRVQHGINFHRFLCYDSVSLGYYGRIQAGNTALAVVPHCDFSEGSEQFDD